jgi:hypothetical protein
MTKRKRVPRIIKAAGRRRKQGDRSAAHARRRCRSNAPETTDKTSEEVTVARTIAQRMYPNLPSRDAPPSPRQPLTPTRSQPTLHRRRLVADPRSGKILEIVEEIGPQQIATWPGRCLCANASIFLE